MKLKLPVFLTHPIGFAGLVLAGIGFIAILIGLTIDLTADHHRAYQGLLTFMIFPAVMTLGLGLIGVSFLLRLRGLRKGGQAGPSWVPAGELFRDLKGATVLKMLVFALVVTVAALLFSFKAYHYTESVAFCGQVCHEPMDPQFAAHADSPHASVACVQCHVGPSFGDFVRAKVSGLEQVMLLATDSYERPIRVHRDRVLPAEITCKDCHWEDKYWGMKIDGRARFGYDLQNSRRHVQMYLNIGGGTPTYGPVGGIHYHMNGRVRFKSPNPEKQEIAWVAVTAEDGSVVEYDLHQDGVRKYTAMELAAMPEYAMDCLDCHNRPAHQFLSPDEAVDRALELGDIDSAIPSIKKVTVDVLGADYPSTEEAMTGIEERIRGFYASHFGGRVLEREQSLEQAIHATQELFRRNIRPEMGVRWNTYPDNIGHRTAPGCFRCHGGNHVSRQDIRVVVSNDCNLCHVFLESSRTSADLLELAATAQYVHPFKHEEHFDRQVMCWDCHKAASPYALCSSCHQKEMQGDVMKFECSTCHRPDLERVTAESCAPCHPIPAGDQHRHPSHGDCLQCHEPHHWSTRDEHQGCVQCHAPGELAAWDHGDGADCPGCAGFRGIGSTLMGLPTGGISPEGGR